MIKDEYLYCRYTLNYGTGFEHLCSSSAVSVCVSDWAIRAPLSSLFALDIFEIIFAEPPVAASGEIGIVRWRGNL